MRSIFAKLHSLHSKEKEPRGHQAKVHISQKEESKKTISRFHFKKDPDQDYNNSALEAQSLNARGLVDGEPYGPPWTILQGGRPW